VGINVFNRLPGYIKDLSHNSKKFKLVLKNFLYTDSFLYIGRILNHNSI
jgi:hypothetical protein